MSDYFVGSEPRVPYTGPWVDLELAPGFVVPDPTTESPPKVRREGSRVQFAGFCQFGAAATRTESWCVRIPPVTHPEFFLAEATNGPRGVVIAPLNGTTRVVTSCIIGIGLHEVHLEEEEGETAEESLLKSDVGKVVIGETLDLVSGTLSLQTMAYLLDSFTPGE